MEGGGEAQTQTQTQTQTLVEAALEVLNTPDPFEKARLGEAAAARWLQGDISVPYRDDGPRPLVPDRPARPSSVKLVSPSMMPKLGKAGSLQSRQAILHSLAHTESWAIDLSWDIIARFGRQEAMPREFFTDFVRVARDEGRHFTLLATRLEEVGSYYGALPAHDGLWDSALQTSKSLLARLAVEHCVHEARGLDVLPTTISRFRNGGDEQTANLLERVVYPEEITHCAAGVKWFRYLCLWTPNEHGAALIHDSAGSAQPLEGESIPNEHEVDHGDGGLTQDLAQNFKTSAAICHSKQEMVIQRFHATVREYFRGPLKPPFNVQARKAAGFGPKWYEPLAQK